MNVRRYMANAGPAADPELVNVAQQQERHAMSVDTVCTFPDGSKDSLRLGRFCRGNCLSSTTFPQCVLTDRRGEQRSSQTCKHFVTTSRRRRSKTDIGPCKRYRFLGRFLRKLRILRLCSKEKSTCRAWRAGGFRAFNVRSPLQEALKLANRQDIECLQRTWGPFFGDYNRFLTLGKRINGGTEGDILEATWRCDDGCQYDVVVKVFKKEGMRALSRGLLQSMAESRFDSFAFDNNALIYKATLLRDGRFALVLRRYSRNLHELIQSRTRPPFLDHEAKHLMLEIANGMNILHQRNILHRDLKPCNVLTLESGPIWCCYVADFECDGAVGTGMYRSPEVLRGLDGREDATSEIIESYQKHSDVYSFGMTCYELCTGLAPFAQSGRTTRDNVAEVLEGRRPDLPEYIDHRVRELIAKCWHPECSLRPSFCAIVAVLKGLTST